MGHRRRFAICRMTGICENGTIVRAYLPIASVLCLLVNSLGNAVSGPRRIKMSESDAAAVYWAIRRL